MRKIRLFRDHTLVVRFFKRAKAKPKQPKLRELSEWQGYSEYKKQCERSYENSN
jgi:hypothetical protein